MTERGRDDTAGPHEPTDAEVRVEEAVAAGESDERHLTEGRRGRRRATRAGTGGGASGTAADDADTGWSDGAAGQAAPGEAARDPHERWLHEQRPPHWD